METKRKTKVYISEQDARKVVYMYATGVTSAKIANIFNISENTVSCIISGATRRNQTGLEKDTNNKYNLRNKTLLIHVDEHGVYSKVFKPTSSTKEPMINREVLQPKDKAKEYIATAKDAISKAVNLDIKVTINGETAPTNALRKILMLIND